ncbi:hypothetical protein GPECTOR_22g895 [Gonium pectorale]|uniref:Post-SET domain-containing protein n=1 Tax=Gonium pectorale TaxID=33097 RepID=A0A150GHH8_GONPE|nr:hypothetical protein GPECTOR_22g895 [Gonium pectorale]|eukprot:KXZ49301.1 hypothetical protein GPECTOR_22g895 [Gonium pectorale]
MSAAIATNADQLTAQARAGQPRESSAQCAEYRRLHDGFISQNVSEWAERRQCRNTGHNALFSRKHFKAGEVLSEFGHVAIHSRPTYLTVQMGVDKHIELSPVWMDHINHSCEPNVLFNTTTFQLEALRDIAPGDELCFFYPSTEWSMISPFECKCGTPSCLGFIAGASQLSREQLAGYRLTDFIANRLDEHEAATSAGSPSDSQ